MSFREKIPSDMLKEFDEIGWESVESNIKLGLYREKNETKAQLYVDHFKTERDASPSARQEARAEETLSVARSAIRISKQHLIIATIAIIVVIIIAILSNK